MFDDPKAVLEISKDSVNIYKGTEGTIVGNSSILFLDKREAKIKGKLVKLSENDYQYLVNNRLDDEELELTKIIKRIETVWNRVGDLIKVPTSARQLVPVLERHGLLANTKTSGNEAFVGYEKVVKFLRMNE